MKLKANQLLYLLIFYWIIAILFFVFSLVYNSNHKHFPIILIPILLMLPSIFLRRAYLRKKTEESKKE